MPKTKQTPTKAQKRPAAKLMSDVSIKTRAQREEERKRRQEEEEGRKNKPRSQSTVGNSYTPEVYLSAGTKIAFYEVDQRGCARLSSRCEVSVTSNSSNTGSCRILFGKLV